VEDLIRKDKNLRKVNLSSTLIKDEAGRPFVFQSVKKAKELILASGDHEYLPIEGSGAFIQAASSLAFSGTMALNEQRLASIQSVGATGGMRLALDFIKRFFPGNKTVYISNPGRYASIIQDVGLKLQSYTYFDYKLKTLDLTLMLEEIEEAPRGSVFIFQTAGHNPTGTDPTVDQWKAIQDVMASRKHLAIFDTASQGLIGSLEQDAVPLKLFANEENPLIVVQSFSQNFGLGGERAGCLSLVCESSHEAARVLSQLKILARPMYSNPPIFGSRVVSTVIGKSDLKNLWTQELKSVSDRLTQNRKELVQALKEKGSPHDWSHLNRQKGLFGYTGLNPGQCSELVDKYHVYVSLDGRISLAGVNKFNVDYVAEAIESVTRFSKTI
jgi:aspartate aminotransferase